MRSGQQTNGLGERLGEIRESILEILKKDSTMSIPRLSEKLGKSDTAIEGHISWLKKNGFLSRDGGARGGRWVVASR